MALTRRELLELMAALGLLAGCEPAEPSTPPADVARGEPPILIHADAPVDAALFAHGVASGDPLAERVILWTRLDPAALAQPGPVRVSWVLARDPELRELVTQGQVETSAARDFTVKVDATRLEPGCSYYYRFALAEASDPSSVRASAFGRTRTLPPEGVEHLRLAYCSCSNYPFGYFNAYAAIARRADLDCVLHLGDYIYEYADGRYGDGKALGRELEPAGELVSLADYRARHATYKCDPDLQELHRQHPLIAVWDDHELANNAWVDGAENHDSSHQGSWHVRRAAAVQAYFEWLPIRGPGPRIERSFRFGGLADLIMLDTRLVGRAEQAPAEDDDARDDPRRSLLGEEQERWLEQRLLESKDDAVGWRLLGQQVAFAQIRFDPKRPSSTDTWDGYASARRRLLELLTREGIEDVAVLTGDIHSSWAFEVGADPWSKVADEREPRLVEFIAPAVTSPGPVPAARAGEFAADFLARHPHLHWVELETRGYVVLDLRRERIQAEWWFVDTVEERRADEHMAKAFVVERGRPRLREVADASAPGPDRAFAP